MQKHIGRNKSTKEGAMYCSGAESLADEQRTIV